jgi:hypothetical protein
MVSVQLMVGDMPLRILCVMSDRSVIQFLQSLFLLLLININVIIILYLNFLCMHQKFCLQFREEKENKFCEGYLLIREMN